MHPNHPIHYQFGINLFQFPQCDDIIAGKAGISPAYAPKQMPLDVGFDGMSQEHLRKTFAESGLSPPRSTLSPPVPVPFSVQSTDPFTSGLGRDGQRLWGAAGVVLAAAATQRYRWFLAKFLMWAPLMFMWIYIFCGDVDFVVVLFSIYFSSPRP